MPGQYIASASADAFEDIGGQIPAGTATNRLYTTGYIWDSVGTVNAAHTYQASSSEPTTLLR